MFSESGLSYRARIVRVSHIERDCLKALTPVFASSALHSMTSLLAPQRQNCQYTETPTVFIVRLPLIITSGCCTHKFAACVHRSLVRIDRYDFCFSLLLKDDVHSIKRLAFWWCTLHPDTHSPVRASSSRAYSLNQPNHRPTTLGDIATAQVHGQELHDRL